MNNLPIYSLLPSQNELLSTDFKENKNRIFLILWKNIEIFFLFISIKN